MRDVGEVRAELEQIAALPALARRRESLEDLAANLDTEEAHLWSKVDLYAAFGQDSIEVPAASKLTSRAGWVELARNLLIMTPLLITWIGISVATRAYGNMLLEDPKSGQRPFIALWEGGFGGRTGVTLSRVGIADVIAFISVIACSLWLSWLRREIDVTVEAEERVTWNRLREALLEASLHLNTRAFDTPARFNEEITRVMKNLGDVTEQVDQAATRAGVAVEGIDSSVTRLGESMGEFTSGVSSQRDAFAVLSQRVDGVSSSLAAFGDRMASLGAALESAVAEQQSLAASLSTGMTDLTAMGSTLATSSTNQSSAASRFLEEVQAERQRQSEMVAAWAGATSAASRAAEALTQVSQGIDSTGTEIGGAIGRAADALDQSVGGLNSMIEGVQRRLSKSEAALIAAGEALPAALNDASEQLKATSLGLADQSSAAHAETRAAVDASARHMEQLTSSLQSATTATAADVRHASESMSVAVDRLIGAVSALEAALANGGQTAQQR
ncbi:MAG: hypothetical protein ACOYXM_17745 [Actinomycetota bacterium]